MVPAELPALPWSFLRATALLFTIPLQNRKPSLEATSTQQKAKFAEKHPSYTILAAQRFFPRDIPSQLLSVNVDIISGPSSGDPNIGDCVALPG